MINSAFAIFYIFAILYKTVESRITYWRKITTLQYTCTTRKDLYMWLFFFYLLSPISSWMTYVHAYVFRRVWKRRPTCHGCVFDLAPLSGAFNCNKNCFSSMTALLGFFLNVTCHQVNNSFKANLLARFFYCTDNSHINLELNLTFLHVHVTLV